MNRLKVKSVVFLTNYFNHHQRFLSEEIYKIIGDGYKFIETEQMSEERKNMGWGESEYPEYVVSSNEFEGNKEKYLSLINDADVVIIGSASNDLIFCRIKNRKLVFRYCERPLKTNKEKWKYPIRFLTWRKTNPQNGSMYLLCSSAYASSDYAKFGLYKNKAYKFGYFTEVKKYDDIDALISKKNKNSILWCARLIPLKHPETVIEIAKRLKSDGYDFLLNVIGIGKMEAFLKEGISRERLEDNIKILGSMTPEKVREHMENSEIFFFTSDRNEGWGAVLNESMNSACAVVASHAIGAVPFLVDDKENGLIYRDGDTEDLYKKIKYLLDNPEERKKISKNAYLTMVNEWNAENAAKKFVTLAESVLSGEKTIDLFESGVCSKANILNDNWY